MDKAYNPKDVEERLYRIWEASGAFTPHIDPKKKPFTILLPPPNASGKMHTGNVLMIAIEDLLIRWHRMKGDPTLWIPGTDHAGTETQITFERELKKQGTSRFSYTRNDLYQVIWEFVQNNKSHIEQQIRQMGASVDWSRYTFTLDPHVIKTVTNTFQKLAQEGLVYRGDYMVNYCPVCGTTYADIEVTYEERKDPLLYIKYGPFTISTVRPETKFRDTALAANPNDSRYHEWIRKNLTVKGLLGDITMKIIPDPEVDPTFGTGIMKVTPAHDPHDFQLGKQFNLPVTPVIDLQGRMDFSWYLDRTDIPLHYRERAQRYHGKKVAQARKLIVEDLKAEGMLEKIDENYIHSVPVCKAGHDIEPMVLPNWFIKVDGLKQPAHEAVSSGKVKIFPKWREITYTRWMEQMHDWAISRQNVWGIRIPAWYDVAVNPQLQISFLHKSGEVITGSAQDLLQQYSFEEIEAGLQTLLAPAEAVFEINEVKPGERYLQDTNTFDTWFSSGQWPLVTLGYPDSEDFNYFYPTSVLETGWEILPKWVSRMIMFGIYLTGKAPFENVYLHGIVRALDGRKMSKSLGNVINPEDYISQYGVDALRMGLISGTANGKDFAFPKDKVIAYKYFANKLWNMGRFLLMTREQSGGKIVDFSDLDPSSLPPADQSKLIQLATIITEVDAELNKFRFADAADKLYHFMWHSVADAYIEEVKNREDKEIALAVITHIYMTGLTLLHPFMPFVTEEIYQKMPGHDGLLISAKWPTVSST